MKRLFALLALLPLITVAQTAPTLTATWTAPTKNTDSSAITAALTYNLYAGTSCTALVKAQRAIATTSVTLTGSTLTGLIPGATYCFAVTAVANGVESAQSNTATVAIPSPTPNAPSQITIVLH